MISDPLAVAASSPNPAYSLSVIRSDGLGSERYDAPNGLNMVVNHTRAKQNTRHYYKISNTVTAEDPYSGLTKDYTATVSLSVTVPKVGFDETAMVNLIKAHFDILADSDFTTTKLLRLES